MCRKSSSRIQQKHSHGLRATSLQPVLGSPSFCKAYIDNWQRLAKIVGLPAVHQGDFVPRRRWRGWGRHGWWRPRPSTTSCWTCPTGAVTQARLIRMVINV